jgi:hypothetical protein
LNIGDTVFHRDFGRGSIVRLYPEGPTAVVDFGYMMDLIPLSFLTRIGPDGLPLSVPATPTTPKSAPASSPAPTGAPRTQPGTLPQGSATRSHPAKPNPKESCTSAPVSDGEAVQRRTGSAVARSAAPVAAGVTGSALRPETIEARRAIVALRLGQVLESHVDHLSVGLAAESSRFERSLEQAQAHHPIFMMVEGTWGQGKTHLLTLLTATAVRHGFAVSNVVMDGVGVTLSDPMLLLEAVTAAIRFPGDHLASGLASHLAVARRNGDLERLGHLGATTLASVFDQIPSIAFDELDAMQVIEDYLALAMTASNAVYRLASLGHRGIRLPALRARSVAERAARFTDLLFNWTQLCAVTGVRGLVVILDELDVEYATTARRGQQQARVRERRRELLDALSRLRRQRLPLVLAFASAPAGPDVDPEHDASTHIPETVGALDQHIIAPSPTDEGLRELLAKVLTLYGQAYPDALTGRTWTSARELADRLIETYRRQPNPVPRFFLRSALESLDLLCVQGR